MSTFITSKNTITDNGLQVGNSVEKDMMNETYTYRFNPYDYQEQFYSGMADFINENIVAGDKLEEDRLIASCWNDLGDDVFDNWGFFYLYDVQSGKYYFPKLYPRNDNDGVFNTQICQAFGRTFTIQHGWAVEGIFKIDIDVSDNLPFRFGAYGNMGSDGDEYITRYYHPLVYSGDNTNMNLYYIKHSDSSDYSTETLYSYFIPKSPTQNTTRSYIYNNDGDDDNIMSVNVQNGLLVYFSKSYDVRGWVISDLNNVTDQNPLTESLIDDENPISNICFPSGTPIQTDQETIFIEQINSNKHTIRGNKIEMITKTITQDSYLVCIEKDALAKNIPSKKTLISKNHKLFYNKKMIKANNLLQLNKEGIYKIKYNGEILYNVLLENHDKMIVNNLICETLDPKNGIAKMYLDMKNRNLSDSEKQTFISEYNEYVIKNKKFISKSK
uniref:Hedgehog/Intein (Hint) domain-containing protein n=1 Tax=viral metagenome TaxID=1070528 RepID=A0A6C0ISY3_9ZZZZ